MDLTNVIFIVERDKYIYFEDYLSSMHAIIRFYPCTIQPGEKIIVMQRLLYLNYHDAYFVGLLNTEQLTRSSELVLYEKYKLSDFKIHFFDYSMANIHILKEKYDIDAIHLPYAYNEKEINYLKNSIKTSQKLYDLAIIGGEAGRRLDMIQQLRNDGVRVLVVQGWKNQRDEAVATCKALLNIHYNDSYMIFEEMRCNRWLMAGMHVISEACQNNNYIMDKFTNLHVFAYDNMVKEVVDYFKKLSKSNTNNDIMTKGVVKNTHLSIGVAIPTYKNDIVFLRRCLDSIEKQTLKPICVAISASSCEKHEVPDFHYSFPIIVKTTTNVQNAAMNRNVAASLLKDVDIISFFDSDDEMTPERLQYIAQSFMESPCDFVVHNFVELKSSKDEIIINTHDYIGHNNVIVPSPREYGVMVKNNVTKLAHGHISISAVLWKNEQFNTTCQWEDSEYARRLTTKGYIGNYIQTMVSIYHNYKESFEDYYLMAATARNNRQYIEAYNFLNGAFLYRNPTNEYVLYYELSIIAYYINRHDIGIFASEKVINNAYAPQNVKDVVKNNLFYYKK